MLAENRLHPSDFIWPLFICDGGDREEPIGALLEAFHRYRGTGLAAIVNSRTVAAPSVVKRVFVPPWVFLNTYFFRLGLLDGYRGLLIAWMAAFTETVERHNPAATATGLAIWGWIVRVVVTVSYAALLFVVAAGLVAFLVRGFLGP